MRFRGSGGKIRADWTLEAVMRPRKFDSCSVVAVASPLASLKSADFVVLEANPLDDIVNTRRISAVYLRGEKIDREALSEQWTSPSSE
jgi:hypothetical protein